MVVVCITIYKWIVSGVVNSSCNIFNVGNTCGPGIRFHVQYTNVGDLPIENYSISFQLIHLQVLIQFMDWVKIFLISSLNQEYQM